MRLCPKTTCVRHTYSVRHTSTVRHTVRFTSKKGDVEWKELERNRNRTLTEGTDGSGRNWHTPLMPQLLFGTARALGALGTKLELGLSVERLVLKETASITLANGTFTY